MSSILILEGHKPKPGLRLTQDFASSGDANLHDDTRAGAGGRVVNRSRFAEGATDRKLLHQIFTNPRSALPAPLCWCCSV